MDLDPFLFGSIEEMVQFIYFCCLTENFLAPDERDTFNLTPSGGAANFS